MHAMQIVEVFLLKCQLKNYLTYRYNKGEFRSRPISAFVYILALSQSECVKRFIT